MIAAAIVGFVFGTMAMTALARWIGFVYVAMIGTRSSDGRLDVRRGITLAACQSLFHAGPWSIAVTVFVAYQVRTEPWAPWLFVGFACGFALMLSWSVRVVMQFRKRARGQPQQSADEAHV